MVSKRWISSDAAGLLIIGLAAGLRGVSYLPYFVDSDRKPAHFLEQAAPPEVWAGPWILSGVLCFLAIWVSRLTPPAVGAGVGLHFLWAVSFLLSGGRGWVSSIGYGAVTALAVWAFSRGRLQPAAEVPSVLKGE